MKSLSRVLVLASSVAVVLAGLTVPNAIAAQVATLSVTVAGQQPSQTMLTQGDVSANVGDTIALTNNSGVQVAVMDPSGSAITDSQGYPCNAPSCSLPVGDTQSHDCRVGKSHDHGPGRGACTPGGHDVRTSGDHDVDFASPGEVPLDLRLERGPLRCQGFRRDLGYRVDNDAEHWMLQE
jgi:hypothetical protein